MRPLAASKNNKVNAAAADASVELDRIDHFVKSKGGSRSIRKVLIANNGMAAAKCIISMRRWAYLTFGDENAITFVAMATPEDLAANAEFIRQADDFIEVRVQRCVCQKSPHSYYSINANLAGLFPPTCRFLAAPTGTTTPTCRSSSPWLPGWALTLSGPAGDTQVRSLSCRSRLR